MGRREVGASFFSPYQSYLFPQFQNAAFSSDQCRGPGNRHVAEPKPTPDIHGNQQMRKGIWEAELPLDVMGGLGEVSWLPQSWLVQVVWGRKYKGLFSLEREREVQCILLHLIRHHPARGCFIFVMLCLLNFFCCVNSGKIQVKN